VKSDLTISFPSLGGGKRGNITRVEEIAARSWYARSNLPDLLLPQRSGVLKTLWQPAHLCAGHGKRARAANMQDM